MNIPVVLTPQEIAAGDNLRTLVRVADPQPRVGGLLVECVTCGLLKRPSGRSAPLGSCHCDPFDCLGYHFDPRPDYLWPNESQADYGYPTGWEGPSPLGEPGDVLYHQEEWRREYVRGEDGHGTECLEIRGGRLWASCSRGDTERIDALGCCTDWQPADTMPEWASRYRYTRVGDARLVQSCKACGETGVMHCAHPEDCNGMEWAWVAGVERQGWGS